jgi:hypothetical protein
LCLLATITLDVVPFRAYASFPALPPCLIKYILEAVFYEAVQQRLRFCLHRLSCVKIAAFSFIFNLRNRKKYGARGKKVILFLVKGSLDEMEV